MRGVTRYDYQLTLRQKCPEPDSDAVTITYASYTTLRDALAAVNRGLIDGKHITLSRFELPRAVDKLPSTC